MTMLTDDQARSLRAVVASRHSTTEERAAAKARLDSAKTSPTVPDPYSDDVRQPSEVEKATMRTLLGLLRDDPQPPAPAPPPVQVPKKLVVPARVVHKPDTAPISAPRPPLDTNKLLAQGTNALQEMLADPSLTEPERLVISQIISERLSRWVNRNPNARLFQEVTVDGQKVILQPAEADELESMLMRAKALVISCYAAEHHKPDARGWHECCDFVKEWYWDQQRQHPNHPVTAAGSLLYDQTEAFSRDYRPEPPQLAESPEKDFGAVWRGVYSGRRIS